MITGTTKPKINNPAQAPPAKKTKPKPKPSKKTASVPAQETRKPGSEPGSEPDWDAIRAEYLSGGIGYRKLGEKYGLPYQRIADRGKKEKWAEARRQTADKTMTILEKKIAEQKAASLEKLLSSTLEVLDAIHLASRSLHASFLPTETDGQITMPVINEKTSVTMRNLAQAISVTQESLYAQLNMLTPAQEKQYALNLRRVEAAERAIDAKTPHVEPTQIVIQVPARDPPEDGSEPEQPTVGDYLA